MKKKKALLLIYCIALAPAALAHDIVTSRYTYREHVLPILNAHCVRCHSPDGPAPFRLTSYLDARPRAEAIKEEAAATKEEAEGLLEEAETLVVEVDLIQAQFLVLLWMHFKD